jgi:thiamine pyrophosphate-dependent acetolactate synthase large subunit-like protein
VIEADVFRALLSILDDEALIVANGYLSRRAYHYKDRASTFYMIGSMGLASSIGLGVALAQPRRRVIVVDGDGNLLMSLGALAMVSNNRPQNFIHIVIDNGEYASTGGQRGIGNSIAMPELALAAGYCSATQILERHQLTFGLRDILGKPGPAFLQIKVTAGADLSPRVGRSPAEIASTFKTALQGQQPTHLRQEK